MNIIQSLLLLPVAERELIMRRAEMACRLRSDRLARKANSDDAEYEVAYCFRVVDEWLDESARTFQEKKNDGN